AGAEPPGAARRRPRLRGHPGARRGRHARGPADRAVGPAHHPSVRGGRGRQRLDRRHRRARALLRREGAGPAGRRRRGASRHQRGAQRRGERRQGRAGAPLRRRRRGGRGLARRPRGGAGARRRGGRAAGARVAERRLRPRLGPAAGEHGRLPAPGLPAPADRRQRRLPPCRLGGARRLRRALRAGRHRDGVLLAAAARRAPPDRGARRPGALPPALHRQGPAAPVVHVGAPVPHALPGLPGARHALATGPGGPRL
ncbi:MAG: hypothetical protein AVDCRST_MAG35-1200, partial [uncultured Quadrisphaera sp.]